jgi:catechol 2,3-dioxygenase-like lactoylglutathione lyase family enzyme
MAIFTHVALGTNDLARSTAFYDKVLGVLGIRNLGALGERATLYGADGPEFLVTKPSNGEAATHANGGTVGFAARDRQAIHDFYETALAHGGSDAGAPGPRDFPPTAYAAYVRDPDGNKLSVYCFADE